MNQYWMPVYRPDPVVTCDGRTVPTNSIGALVPIDTMQELLLLAQGAVAVGLSSPFVVAHGYSNKQCGSQGRTVGDNVLLDTAVIPAGTLGPNSMIDVYAMYSFTGGNTKDPLIRIGPTGGQFATALNVLNNQGFSSQSALIVQARGHNKGSMASNVWTPPQGSGLGNQGGNALVHYAVDFSQSVTVYFGATFFSAATSGDPAEIVRLETFSITVTK